MAMLTKSRRRADTIARTPVEERRARKRVANVMERASSYLTARRAISVRVPTGRTLTETRIDGVAVSVDTQRLNVGSLKRFVKVEKSLVWSRRHRLPQIDGRSVEGR